MNLPVFFYHRTLAIFLVGVVIFPSALASSSQQQRTVRTSSVATAAGGGADSHRIPVFDLASTDTQQLASDIADACSTYGFFQVVNHGISADLIARFREQCQLYFELPMNRKKSWKRNDHNSRGFFDDEFTKQRRDWKQCLDVGVPGSRDWTISDDAEANACLDGFNQFPGHEILPDFRPTILEYFDACAALSDRLARLMALGVGLPENDPFITDLRENHSSYLRMNYYPLCEESDDPATLGISPHKDAGFLTILLQDDDCHSLEAEVNGEWLLAHPVPGGLTINTGDMAEIWSNGKYKAPQHRVLTSNTKTRYSAPFFYNPGYHTFVRPFISDTSKVKYHPCLWGYFRAVRFAGDLKDFDVEIQINDFEIADQVPSAHLKRQEKFHENELHRIPFDVGRYEYLMKKYPGI